MISIEESPEGAEWRVVPSYPDYEVSEYGHLRRCKPNRYGWFDPRLLNPRVVRTYDMYGISVNGKDKKVYAHHLVIEAFTGPKPFRNAQVRHLDGTRRNHHYSNLEWGSPKENQSDRFVHGTNLRGEDCPVAKLSEEQVLKIRDLAAKGATQRGLGKQFGMSQSAIFNIIHRNQWAHI